MDKNTTRWYPAYDDLPVGLVSLAELVEIVNEAHSHFPIAARNGHDAFTRSMATNYIKQGLTGPAIGKKYNREHVCRILFAATSKLVLQATDVHRVTHELFDDADCRVVHDAFAVAFNERLMPSSTCVNPETLEEMIATSVAAKVRGLSMLEA